MGKVWSVLKWLIGLGVLLALVLGGAGLLLWPTIKKQMEARAGGQGEMVRLEPVAKGELVRTVSAPGFLEATRKVAISARFSAQIVELPFDEGDAVREGDLLVKLDDRDLLAQLDSAKAGLAAEEARLSGARASFINAVAEWERQSALFASKDVPKSAFDSAEAERNRAESNLKAAEAAIEQARARITQVEEDLRYTRIQSPINGTVTRLNAEVGEVVITGTMNNPGTVILEIADLSEMIVRTEVDETDIADVRIGQKARVYINAYPDEVFSATVTKIGLQRVRGRDNQSEVFIVEALLDLQGRTLFAGLTASVDIEVETVQDVLLAPSQAVLDVRIDELPAEVTRDNPIVDRNKTFARVVYVMEDGEAVATPVRTGASDLRTTAIVAGLDPGTPVIVGPYKALLAMKHGAKVRDEEKVKAEEEARKAAAQARRDRRKDDAKPGDTTTAAAAEGQPEAQPAAQSGDKAAPAPADAGAAPADSSGQPTQQPAQQPAQQPTKSDAPPPANGSGNPS